MREAPGKTPAMRAERAERDGTTRMPAAPESPLFAARGLSFDGMGNRALLSLLRSGHLQRKARAAQPGVPAEGRADRKADGATLAPAAPRVAQMLADPGKPLAPALRQHMERRFGHDFSQVRIHTDTKAADSARAVQAQAYTVGRDVVFSEGQYQPHTREGSRLLAHELAHVIQQERGGAPPNASNTGKLEHAAEAAASAFAGGSRSIRTEGTSAPGLARQPTTKPAGSETKPQIIAIEAGMDAKQATATLSDGKIVPLTLSKNDYPPGTRVLNHQGNGKYNRAAPIVDPKDPQRTSWSFMFINPYLPGTQEVSYAWAPSITVTISLTAEQRIGRLPAHIRNALTTDKGEKAGADEIENVALAGELLEQAGVTAQDMILYDEQIKAGGAAGANVTEVDALDFARSFVGMRAQQQQQSVQRLDDIVTISQVLVNEPLYLLRSGGLDSVLDPGSDTIELSIALSINEAYRVQGRLGDFDTLDVAGRSKFMHELVVGLRTLLQRFEQALLTDLRALANGALDAAEASILLLDKRFTGIWQEIVPGPGFLRDEIDRINQSEPIVRATDARIEATAAIDREQIIDEKKRHHGYFGPSLKEVIEYSEREARRDQRRKQVEAEFEEAVRKNSGLKLPPGKSAREILDAKNSDTAVTLLRDYLYDGRKKIRAARTKISDDKVLYAAEMWVRAEQERLKAVLGAQLGGEIAVLIDRFARLRKSQTSIWEDLLRIVEFVSMFVPGPIGWGLRAGTAILSADQALSQAYTQNALYGAGGTKVPGSSGTLAVVNAAVNMIPDAGVVAKGAGAGEHLATRGLERAGAGVADDTAKLAGQALDDTAKAGGHAATEGAETTVKSEERVAAAHGEAPTKPEATAPPDDDVLMRIRGEDEVQTLSLNDLRGRRNALTREKAELESAARRKQEDIDRLRENVVALEAEMKEPRRLMAEDRIDELERELANQRAGIAGVDRRLAEAEGDLLKLQGPKPPASAPAPPTQAPVKPVGEVAIPAQPVTLRGTRMQSWSDRVYIATSKSGYRPNVEKLLLKDPEGPLSKALLIDRPGGGKMIREMKTNPTKEIAEAYPDLFVAGHFKSKNALNRVAGEGDVIVLTSARRNMEFAGDLEHAATKGARMGEFVYVIQGIAVEPGTAWGLVRSTTLDPGVRARLAQELTEANKLFLAR